MMGKYVCWLGILVSGLLVSPAGAEVLFQDDFERQESDDTKEEVGNGWTTNSKSRAQGNKQVDLIDGAMFIQRHEVADHGVSVVQDVDFKNAKISLRFKLGPKDDIGINIADMKEKSVHAGHICMAKVTPWHVELDRPERPDACVWISETQRRPGTLNAADEEMMKYQGESKVKYKVVPDQWHEMVVVIEGTQMSVSIDGKEIGSFDSEGIGHDTKRRIRLAVNKSAWVDDVKVESL